MNACARCGQPVASDGRVDFGGRVIQLSVMCDTCADLQERERVEADLLEEIKRLRAWLAHVSVCAEWVCSGAATGIYVTEIVDAVTAALNGEAVPEKEDK